MTTPSRTQMIMGREVPRAAMLLQMPITTYYTRDTSVPLHALALAEAAWSYTNELLAVYGDDYVSQFNMYGYTSPTQLLRALDPAQPLIGQVIDCYDVDGVLDLLWRYAEANGRIGYSNQLSRNAGIAGTDGETGAWDIKLTSSSTALQRSKVVRLNYIAHEMGHALLNHQWAEDRRSHSRRTEYEAEAFAYVLLKSLNVSCHRGSVQYMNHLGWPRDGKSFGRANFAAAYGFALASRDEAMRLYA